MDDQCRNIIGDRELELIIDDEAFKTYTKYKKIALLNKDPLVRCKI